MIYPSMKGMVLGIGILVILLVSSFAVGVGSGNVNGSENKNVKGYTPHGVIRINSDTDFDSSHGVVGGSGTQSNPYIISGWDIDAHHGGDAIYIGNTTMYFVVENCYLHNTSSVSYPYSEGDGIMLYNTTNGKVVGNNITKNEQAGIYVYSSFSNNIAGNNVSNNDYGIYIDLASSNVIKTNNLTSNNYQGILSHLSSNNTISSNNIANNGEYGIYLWHSSNNNTISDNNITYNGYAGILVYYNSLNNTIIRNALVKDGIVLDGDKKTFTTQNITTNNTVNGKPVYYYKNVVMDNITAPLDAGEIILGNVSWLVIKNLNLSNASVGIELGYSSYIMITESNIRGNMVGIYSAGSNNSIIRGNNIFNNRNIGINILYSSNNTISNNDMVYNERYDVWSILSSNNTISKNNISGSNNDGVYLGWHSSNNIVTGNNISNNHNYGIYIDSYSSYNIIYNNTFYYNNGSNDTYNSSHIQAYDSNSTNHWNSTTGIGNYWYDWANNNNTNDNSHDGIVDWPYEVNGSADAKDYYPLKNPSLNNVLSHPLNLAAKGKDNYVNLTWNPPAYGGDTVTEYKIYRNNAIIATVPATQLWYNDTNVMNGQTYTYYVTAVNSVGESEKSNEVQATPGGTVPEFSTGIWMAILILIFLLGVIRFCKYF